MPGPFNFPEWLNSNSRRAYPLREDASRESVAGEVILPNELIVDARLNVPSEFASGTFYVSSVELLPDRVSVSVSFSQNDTEAIVTTVVAELDSHTPNQAYLFQGIGEGGSVMGSISIGKIEDVVAQVQGAFEFTPETAPFEPTVVYISQPMVERIILLDQEEEISSLSGVVRFKGGDNVRLTRIDASTIRIDAISGENLTDCEDPSPLSPPIRTINGVPPDEAGDFWIKGSECLSVSTLGSHTLELRDLCSSSCCGCTEMESILSSLRQYETQQAALRNEIYRVYSETSTVIASLTSFLAS